MKLQLKRFGHNVMLVAAMFGAIFLWLGTSVSILVLWRDHEVLGALASNRLGHHMLRSVRNRD